MLAAFALGLASIASALVSGGTGNAGFVFPLLMFGALALVGRRRRSPDDPRRRTPGYGETQEAPVAHVVSRCSSRPRRFFWDRVTTNS